MNDPNDLQLIISRFLNSYCHILQSVLVHDSKISQQIQLFLSILPVSTLFSWHPFGDQVKNSSQESTTYLVFTRPPWKTWVDRVSSKIPTNSTISLILSEKIVYCIQLTAQCTAYSISSKLISPMIWKLRDIISSILITSLSCVCFHYQTTHFSYGNAWYEESLFIHYYCIFISILKNYYFYKYLVFHILVIMKWHVIYIMVFRRW